MLELKNINKSFGSLQVLDNVSATFGRGEVVSIVGPSGAGKTTLLQIAGTLDKPVPTSLIGKLKSINRMVGIVLQEAWTLTEVFLQKNSRCVNLRIN